MPIRHRKQRVRRKISAFFCRNFFAQTGVGGKPKRKNSLFQHLDSLFRGLRICYFGDQGILLGSN